MENEREEEKTTYSKQRGIEDIVTDWKEEEQQTEEHKDRRCRGWDIE